jgi:predicted nucleic acid-binding protein
LFYFGLFYNNAIDRYNEFLSGISKDFHIEFLSTDLNIQNLALSQMRFFQLEAYDALHYAIATYNGYNYFATLDGDFVHNLYSESPTATKIVKIA